MMNKLESVKKRLDAIYIINTKLDNTKEETARLAQEALAELKEVMDRLNSEEFIGDIIDKAHEDFRKYRIEHAGCAQGAGEDPAGSIEYWVVKTAINIITGKNK